MSFPGLYNEVMHVPQKNYYYCTYWCCTHALTKPTDVPIAVFTYLLYLLLCLRMCTSYCYTYVLPCWYTCVYALKKKKLVHLHSLRRHCTYWCTYSMYLLLMHARTSKKKNYLRWTYVPTVRTALTNAISTHLLHKSTVPTVRTYYCCTYSYWWMYSSTAVRTSCTHFKYLTITYVHEARKAETYEEKNCQGTWWDVNTQARAKPR